MLPEQSIRRQISRVVEGGGALRVANSSASPMSPPRKQPSAPNSAKSNGLGNNCVNRASVWPGVAAEPGSAVAAGEVVSSFMRYGLLLSGAGLFLSVRATAQIELVGRAVFVRD